MKMIYKWSGNVEKLFSKVDAQVAGERVEKIRQRNGGSLTKEDVLQDAETPTSPLHPLFEWNDDVAAQRYRLEQAGSIIRHIEVVKLHVDQTEPIRAFVSVIRSDDTKKTYVSIDTAMSDPTLRAQVLDRAHKELLSWKARYENYEEFAEIVAVINGATVAA
jgi:hypothetical protein